MMTRHPDGSTDDQTDWHVRRASLEDLEDVARIQADAARWLESTGRWNDWPTDLESARNNAVRRSTTGETFVVVTSSAGGDELIAAGTLTWSDPRYWGPDDKKAGYIHRLAVAPEWMNRGVGAYLLGFFNTLIRNQGRHFTRLDVPEDNSALLRYYTSRGFQAVGVYKSDSYKGVLLEHQLPTEII